MLAATAPERAPNGDFGGRSFQGVSGAPTAMRAVAPGFPGAANTPGAAIGAPSILRDTPGRRTDATVQYNCVVPMGPKNSRENAETAGLIPGALAFVHNDDSLQLRGRFGPDKMQRLVSYEHLASQIGEPGTTGITSDELREAIGVKNARAYPDAVQVCELRSDYQVIPLQANAYSDPEIRKMLDSLSYVITSITDLRNTDPMQMGQELSLGVRMPWMTAWLASPFLMWADQGGAWWNRPDKGGNGPDWNAGLNEVVRTNDAFEGGEQEQDDRYADWDDMPQKKAYRTLIYDALDGEGGAEGINRFRAHGIVIYKFATQGKDVDAEIELDYRQNGIFNLCVQGKTLSSSVVSFATTARDSSKRQKRLVTLPRDRMYIVVVGRLNPTGKGLNEPPRPGSGGPGEGTPCIDHIRYERTTSEEFLQQMRFRMSYDKGSFLRENEVILGAWRLGSVTDNAASRALPSGSPTSAMGLQAMGVTMQVGIRWVSSFELHETYYIDLTEPSAYDVEQGTANLDGSLAAGVPASIVQKEYARRAAAFLRHNEPLGVPGGGGGGGGFGGGVPTMAAPPGRDDGSGFSGVTFGSSRRQ